MEITLVGVASPHGTAASHATASIAATDKRGGGSRRVLLTGVNLVRPLGPQLGGIAGHPKVHDMQSVEMGTEAHDGQLEVPGSIVVPVLTVSPAPAFNLGGDFVRLIFDSNGLSLDPASPDPGGVPHISMRTDQATSEDDWKLSDPIDLNVQLPVFKQTVPGDVGRVHEGALVLFRDRAGLDALGIAVDVVPVAGGGGTVRAFALAELFGNAVAVGKIL